MALPKAETANVMRPTARFLRHDTGRTLCQEIQKPAFVTSVLSGTRFCLLASIYGMFYWDICNDRKQGDR